MYNGVLIAALLVLGIYMDTRRPDSGFFEAIIFLVGVFIGVVYGGG